ncbi:MAG: ergothioneine biosynthesis protein EgtB [Brumimicrobium sp.]
MNKTLVLEDILAQFQMVRKQTESICEPLLTEDYVPQPRAEVSPPKWHLAHSTWFFEQFVLVKYKADYQIYHKDYSYLFNSYYNNMGDRILKPNRGLMTRPTVDEVYDYRAYVNAEMSKLLDQTTNQEVIDIVKIGLNHEQQHQELLVYDIKYILGFQPTFPAYANRFIVKPNQAPEEWYSLEKGLYSIGASGSGFFYDNEAPEHKVYIQNCAIRNTLVTNREYLAFINAGGYKDFNLWHEEAWEYINENKINTPLYWHNKNGEWFNYTLGGLKSINLDAPVQHVSFYEAFAFAEWKGVRLPTEFEWEALSEKFNWGQLWEWTYSHYEPYPNFKKAHGALGEYNGKFMLNQNVLRGASVATAQNHSRKTYRNFFHASSRWIFSGIRLAKSL